MHVTLNDNRKCVKDSRDKALHSIHTRFSRWASTSVGESEASALGSGANGEGPKCPEHGHLKSNRLNCPRCIFGALSRPVSSSGGAHGERVSDRFCPKPLAVTVVHSALGRRSQVYPRTSTVSRVLQVFKRSRVSSIGSQTELPPYLRTCRGPEELDHQGPEELEDRGAYDPGLGIVRADGGRPLWSQHSEGKYLPHAP